MKHIILGFASLAMFSSMQSKAQMNVGSASAPNASAMLQVSGAKGFALPVLTSTARAAIPNAATGLMIYNSSTNQMEVNTGTPAAPAWTATTGSATIITAQPVDISILGYIPSSISTASTAPTTFTDTYLGVASTYTKAGAFTSSFNNHSYAVYKQTSGTPPTWFGAYDAAQSLGGYLATFTSYTEWSPVFTNILSGVTNNLWIGMAKRSWRAGVTTGAVPLVDVIDWITGEHSIMDYSGGGVQNIWQYNNFIINKPTTSFGFIQAVAASTGKFSDGGGTAGTLFGWQDISAASSASTTGFIVEFKQ